LTELSTDEVKVRIIGSGVGAITESDVTLAESSEAVFLALTFVLMQLHVKKPIKTVSIFVTTASSIN
jgi:translation initiation factor IF-2